MREADHFSLLRSELPVWRRWGGRIGTLVLGGVLLVAAWAKAIDPATFAEQIGNLGLDRPLGAWPTALLVIALEVGLGLALVLDVRRPIVLVPASLLVGLFLFLTGWEWWRAAHGLVDPAAGCGCFGNLVDRTPKQAFFQDLAMLLPPLVLAWLGLRRYVPRQGWRVAGALVAALASAGFAAKAPDLPLDDLATRLRPGVDTAAICVGAEGSDERACLPDVVPELAAGHHWVILTGLETPRFVDSIEALNQFVLRDTGAALWVVSPAAIDQIQAFFWDWGPAFEIRQAPESLLRPLYRRLPRSFEVRDGRVTATFDGLPPALVAETRG